MSERFFTVWFVICAAFSVALLAFLGYLAYEVVAWLVTK